MEAAGVPRLDVERAFSQSWSAAQRGALVSVGHRAGTTAGSSPWTCLCRRGGRGTKHAGPFWCPVGLPNCMLETLAY